MAGMNRLTRRTLLRNGSVVGAVAVAGCLADSPADGAGNETGTGAGTEPDGDLESEVHHLEGGATGQYWDEERTGFVTLLESPQDQPWMLEADDAEAWYAETDFEASSVLYIESVGPNTCTDTLEVADVRIENGVLAGDATVIEEQPEDSADGDEMMACGQAITYSSALVRVTGEDLPDEATITVTDGWGDTETVETGEGPVDLEALPGSVRPDGEPETVPSALECDTADFERLSDIDEDGLEWGDLQSDGRPVFALRIEGDEPVDDVERGETVTITLTNVSPTVQETGNESKYALQVQTEAGWEEVRGTTEPERIEYTEEALAHPPGDGFEWTFSMTEEGVLEGHPHEERLTVCPGLEAGRYRFVFWGLIGDRSLSVAFDFDG